MAGDTASSHDFTRQLHNRAPVVLGLVAVLAFVLLLAAFRSVAIPLVSIILNLMSVGAAYGLITLIFQDGRLQGALGYTAFGGIISWVPLFMFVFLFGISMDYHVFILSRIRELWSHSFLPRDAVVGGIASSAGVVTSATLIMVAVFSYLRHHVARRPQDPRGGHGRRRADRRHRSPRHPAPRRPRAARRPQLVRTEMAAPSPAPRLRSVVLTCQNSSRMASTSSRITIPACWMSGWLRIRKAAVTAAAALAARAGDMKPGRICAPR